MTIQEFVEETLRNDCSGHDKFHAERVAKLAAQLAEQEGLENEQNLIQTAAYVHDVIDIKVVSDVDEAKQALNDVLSQSFTSEDVNHIFEIIEHLSYSKNLDQQYVLSKEGQVVQDADRIDALGAIGIARTFAFGGANQRTMYDPTIKPQKELTQASYQKYEGTTINHFYEKLLKLESMMNTQSGKRIAHERTLYMRQFLDEFYKEWDGQK